VTTIEQLTGITSQHNEIVKRVGNGSLDASGVKRALQNIIEGKLPTTADWSPPVWWRTPEQQLARARQLWPDAFLPEPPKEFTPRTKSEVLLLHVPDSFDNLWNLVDAPTGYTKYRWAGIMYDERNLRLAPGKIESMGPVWLAFDPEHGKGERPPFWGQADLAASEVFLALIQFPEWPLEWPNEASSPCLSGYRLKYRGTWHIPCILLSTNDRQLELEAVVGTWSTDGNSSPTVREC
jgi:hypothetical protein